MCYMISHGTKEKNQEKLWIVYFLFVPLQPENG